LGIGDWGLGIGDWAQSPYQKLILYALLFINYFKNKLSIKYKKYSYLNFA